MKTWDILGLGCVAVDDLLYVPSFPVANTKVRVLTRERQCGGLAGTALVTAARLGARCAFAGLLGTDELSRVIEENFQREGVEVSFAPRSEDAPTPHSVIIVGTETGSRNIFYRIEGHVGADDRLPDESIIRSARVLFIDQIWHGWESQGRVDRSGCQKPVEADMIENVLAKDINGLEPRLTRQGYNAKVLAELLNAKPREIKSFLSGQLASGRTRESQSELLAAGIPL